MQDQLHASRLVEESLQHERALRRNRAERGSSCGEVFEYLIGRPLCQAGFSDQPAGNRTRIPALSSELGVDVGPKLADGCRQLVAARWRLTQPEGDGWRRAMCVDDADGAGGDALDLPRSIAQLEDIARHAFDREVLVECPDKRILGLENDAIIRNLGDGAP